MGNRIIEQINEFKRKYWLFRLLQGVMIFLGTGLVFFGLVSWFEGSSWLSAKQRTLLFVITLVVELVLLVYYIFWPLFQLLTHGRALKNRRAAEMIGKSFPEVEDKLVNYLEMKDLEGTNELIDSGLLQKERNLSVFSFRDAIHWRVLKPFLLFLLPLFIMLGFMSMEGNWNSVRSGAYRLIFFNQDFERTLPFQVRFESALVVEETEDFTLEFSVQGDFVPNEMLINSSRGQTVLKRSSGGLYKTTFSNCTEDISFQLIYDDAASQTFFIKVRKKIAVGRTSVYIVPPAYTKLEPYQVDNAQSVQVPQYSRVEVRFAFRNVQRLLARVKTNGAGDEAFEVASNEVIKLKALNPMTVSLENAGFELSNLELLVLRDLSPVIKVETDSIERGLSLKIFAGDDYAIRKANVVLVKVNGDREFIPLPYAGNVVNSSFILESDVIKGLSGGFVEVFDDHYRSEVRLDFGGFVQSEKAASDLLNKAGESVEALLEKKSEKSSNVEAERSKAESLKEAKRLEKTAEELAEKDSVAFERFKELSEEIRKLAEEMNKEIPPARERMAEEKMEELLKALEMEWMILKTIDQLNKLDQTILKEDKVVGESEMKELMKSSEELKSLLKEKQKDQDVSWEKFEELNKDNKELGEQKQQQNEGKNAPPKSTEQQLKDKMKKSSDQLKQELSEMSDLMTMEAMEQNIELLRRLEIRALKTSKNQELIYRATDKNQVVENEIFVRQKEVNTSARGILDSLVVVTVSDPQLGQFLMDYQTRLDEHLQGVQSADENDPVHFSSSQRFLQYGLNDLAAILYDILKNENENMKNMKEGNKSCNKPKPGKGKKPSLSQQQKQIGEKMKEGGKPGKGKEGQTMSKEQVLELIKMQEQVLGDLKQEEGKGGSGDKELIDEMNKQLDDLINGNIDRALERNRKIEDKLITIEESENKKDDQDEKRQSRESSLNYDAIRESVLQDYLKSKLDSRGVVTLPALKNYFSGKWIIINQK